MKARTVTAVLVIVAAAAVAGALENHHRIEGRGALAPITHRHAEDETARTLNRARMRLAAAELTRDAARAGLAREGGTAGPTAPVTRPSTRAETQNGTLDDPRGQALRVAARRAWCSLHYETLVRRLGLSSDETAVFTRLLSERDAQDMAHAPPERAQAVPTGDPAPAAPARGQEDDTEASLHVLLGDDRYAVFREYDRTSALRVTASSLVAAATVAGEALSPDQAESLVQILAESCREVAAGRRLHPASIDWALADPRIKAILTPAQWEQLRWTELSGPMGYAGRFLPPINAAVAAGYRADLADAIAATSR